jgi:hypothetical protein
MYPRSHARGVSKQTTDARAARNDHSARVRNVRRCIRRSTVTAMSAPSATARWIRTHPPLSIAVTSFVIFVVCLNLRP